MTRFSPDDGGGTSPMFEMRGISKSYAEKVALNSVDFRAREREIVGLFGDNGAGKSTLIKVLSGLIRSDAGSILHRGQTVRIESPSDAQALGIETIHQRGSTIGEMTIWENFFLGREAVRQFGPLALLDKARMRAVTAQRTRELGIDLPTVERRIETLSGGEQQAVVDGRAIHFGGDLLIMDEPTSALSIRETDKVLGYVANARDNLGKSVIFITYIIRHIYPIADRFVVLCKGDKIADVRRDDIARPDLENLVINGP
ncbi:MAG: sugar ABC transporter ATP-binding protein [Alphaproteobacteria bacterium]|nr:sugar ABC transporter ATP-binding protein [Alphaproteobacteria bacterium]